MAAHLLEQGHDVTALTTNGLIADAINARGFRVRGEASPGVVPGRAVRKLDASTAVFDFVLLATQPPQVEEAARGALAHLHPAGKMVCFQNGLCEERVQAIAGDDRVIGAIVAWGATMLEPGVYERTSAGGFVLGRLDQRRDARVEQLAQLLEPIGPTSTTDNLLGARWSKLAINCAISSLGTIGGDRLGVLMRHRFVRRLALEIMTEAVEIARATGVSLEKVSGTLDLDWLALTDAERSATASPTLVAKHALLLGVGARYRRLRSSMLSAIERGRPPAVEFLNGEIIGRGITLGIPTPINYAAREHVLAIAARERRSSVELLRALYERTRAFVTPSVSVPPEPPPSELTLPMPISVPSPMSDARATEPLEHPSAWPPAADTQEGPLRAAAPDSRDSVATAWPTEPSQ